MDPGGIFVIAGLLLVAAALASVWAAARLRELLEAWLGAQLDHAWPKEGGR